MLLYCYTFEKNYMKPQIIEETVEVRETKNMYICTHGQWMPDYTTRIAKKDMEKLLRGKHYFSTVPAKNEAITALAPKVTQEMDFPDWTKDQDLLSFLNSLK